MIWFAITALSLVAMLFVLLPLLQKKKEEVSETAITSSVLMDQLGELERDRSSGLISESEADAAQKEIKRRILSATHRKSRPLMSSGSSGTAVLVASALFVPAMAIGYYVLLGSPSLPSMAFADRENERQEIQQISAMTDQLLSKLESDPEGGNSEGWQLLGGTYMRLGRTQDAVQALEKAVLLEGNTSVTWSMLAEALVRMDQGIVSPRAAQAADTALELNAKNPAATFYKALALAQAGRERDAYDVLVARLKAAEAFSPWMEPLIEQANRLGKTIGQARLKVSDFVQVEPTGPTAEDVAAAQELSSEERSEFIRSMVERLSERLKSDPDNLDGWLRLANAYEVMGESAKAVDAFKQASTLLTDVAKDDPRRLLIEQTLADVPQ
ncbi:cytochrome c-type biogenesis protein CcmH [Pseudovibrio denitrificans]|uniref:Cytochrome c-type biogenesis protein CcmH n=1 Tax=Pseudovibrio denitrificans TaxID=258256 RepID=A0A1I6YLF4_9HYPH|nr:c-type cytochrome biogenesis protein CcmI [Pseudovibrio denitrificans]SFT51081.1 cytochrome c-type biogenesis protein CcmH [Pseudovibrio denitrificans]